jgi:hypothetical protein
MVPKEDSRIIDKKESDEFRIITKAIPRDGLKRLYVIEAADEEVTFLKLKYGEHNVWKR